MAIGSYGGVTVNPVSIPKPPQDFLGGIRQWVDPRRHTLLALAAGLAGGKTPSEGIAMGLQNAAAYGKPADDAYARSKADEAKREADLNATMRWVRKAYPQFAELPAEQAYDLASKLYVSQQTGGSETKFGVTPIWGQFDDGTFGYGVQGTDGSFKRVDTGDLTPLDPRTLNAERAAGTTFGRGQGNAVFDLPQSEWLMNETVREIDELRNHPGLKEEFGPVGGVNVNGMGIPGQMVPAWPGSNKSSFRVRRDQIVGRSFLAAYETLRGGGQITEVEGRKAQDAIARMSTAASEQEFLTALDDFERAVKEGYAKLQQQATMPARPTLPQAGGGAPDADLELLLKKYE